MSHTKSGPDGSRTIDRGVGRPRLRTSPPKPLRGYPAAQPQAERIPGHLQRARHLKNRKNPRHPSAMPISRVQPGVPFVCYDTYGKMVWARGTFKSFPTTTPLLPHETGYKFFGLWVHAQLEDGQAVMLTLDSMGIIPTEYGYSRHVTVSPKREHLLDTHSFAVKKLKYLSSEREARLLNPEDEIQHIRNRHIRLTASMRR